MKKFIIMCGVASAIMAGSSAQAAVQICDGNCADFADNVLITSNNAGALVQFGSAGLATIKFTSTENITAPSNGQARIEAVDGELNNLTFELLDGYAFTSAVFNLFSASLNSTQVTITYFDPASAGLVDKTFDLSNSGQNFMGIYGTAGEAFTKIAFSFAPGGVSDLRQLRLDGVGKVTAVPEPATWALMIGGLGLVGMQMRRRKTTVAFG